MAYTWGMPTIRRSRRRSTKRSTTGVKRLSMKYKGNVVYKGPNGGKFIRTNGTKQYLPNTTRRRSLRW